MTLSQLPFDDDQGWIHASCLPYDFKDFPAPDLPAIASSLDLNDRIRHCNNKGVAADIPSNAECSLIPFRAKFSPPPNPQTWLRGSPSRASTQHPPPQPPTPTRAVVGVYLWVPKPKHNSFRIQATQYSPLRGFRHTIIRFLKECVWEERLWKGIIEHTWPDLLLDCQEIKRCLGLPPALPTSHH